MSELNKDQIISESVVDGDTLQIDIWYPRCEGQIKRFRIGLMDVRAADDIRISYDFDRDGWLIEQASIFEWPIDDLICDPGWKEVAFIQAWSQDITSDPPKEPKP